MEINEIKNKISPVLKSYGIKRASVFGSVSRGENRPESDIDILISIGEPMGMLSFVRMKREIEKTIGKKVDLITEQSMNKFVRPYITKELHTIYEG